MEKKTAQQKVIIFFIFSSGQYSFFFFDRDWGEQWRREKFISLRKF